jgi:hypothetical protein
MDPSLPDDLLRMYHDTSGHSGASFACVVVRSDLWILCNVAGPRSPLIHLKENTPAQPPALRTNMP